MTNESKKNSSENMYLLKVIGGILLYLAITVPVFCGIESYKERKKSRNTLVSAEEISYQDSIQRLIIRRGDNSCDTLYRFKHGDNFVSLDSFLHDYERSLR